MLTDNWPAAVLALLGSLVAENETLRLRVAELQKELAAREEKTD